MMFTMEPIKEINRMPCIHLSVGTVFLRPDGVPLLAPTIKAPKGLFFL
jgi:hypothetical protein